jgi:hypothetical protein
MKKLLYLSLLFISATLLAQENKPNVAENYTKRGTYKNA